MNIKYGALALMIAATLFSQTAFAAAANPTDAECPRTGKFSPGQGNEQMMLQQQRHKQMRKAHRNFRRSEAELLKTLPELDKEAAAARIEEFYTGVFAKLPRHSPRILGNLTSEIQSMDIPEDIKAQIVAKIENYPQERVLRMQRQAITFAKTMLALPPAEQKEAIISYNRFIENYVIRGNKRVHEMHSMKRNRRMQRPRMNNCPYAGYQSAHYGFKENCMNKDIKGKRHAMNGNTGEGDMPQHRKFRHRDNADNCPRTPQDCNRQEDCPHRPTANPQPEE